MDRCRCDEYKAAVDKLKFYIPGTYRPDVIDNYDSTGYTVRWVRHKLECLFDAFTETRAWASDIPPDPLSENARRMEHMWCGHMSQYRGTRHALPATGLPDQQVKKTAEQKHDQTHNSPC